MILNDTEPISDSSTLNSGYQEDDEKKLERREDYEFLKGIYKKCYENIEYLDLNPKNIQDQKYELPIEIMYFHPYADPKDENFLSKINTLESFSRIIARSFNGKECVLFQEYLLKYRNFLYYLQQYEISKENTKTYSTWLKNPQIIKNGIGKRYLKLEKAAKELKESVKKIEEYQALDKIYKQI